MRLSEDQLSAIHECMDDFRAATNFEAQEAIVEDLYQDFKTTWPDDEKRLGFVTMKIVCSPFVILGWSHTFVAYLAELQ